jgi:hypothetical protein
VFSGAVECQRLFHDAHTKLWCFCTNTRSVLDVEFVLGYGARQRAFVFVQLCSTDPRARVARAQQRVDGIDELLVSVAVTRTCAHHFYCTNHGSNHRLFPSCGFGLLFVLLQRFIDGGVFGTPSERRIEQSVCIVQLRRFIGLGEFRLRDDTNDHERLRFRMGVSKLGFVYKSGQFRKRFLFRNSNFHIQFIITHEIAITFPITCTFSLSI